MPIYEYRCEECGHEMDALQKIADAPLTDCPSCSKAALRKLVSAVGFRLKGGGWYETDFKDSNKKNLAGDSGDKKSSESAEGKSEKTTASKSESSAGSSGDKKASESSSKKKVEKSASNAA